MNSPAVLASYVRGDVLFSCHFQLLLTDKPSILGMPQQYAYSLGGYIQSDAIRSTHCGDAIEQSGCDVNRCGLHAAW